MLSNTALALTTRRYCIVIFTFPFTDRIFSPSVLDVGLVTTLRLCSLDANRCRTLGNLPRQAHASTALLRPQFVVGANLRLRQLCGGSSYPSLN